MDHYCMVSSRETQGLILDDEMSNAIELICQYVNREKVFEKDGKSLYKGLWLEGNFGSGKTILIKTYKDVYETINKDSTVGIRSCVDMNSAFMRVDKGSGKVDRYFGIQQYANKFDKIERIFDDLGEEETMIFDFGNRICVMAHILSERYKGFNSGVVTHITTNLTLEEVSSAYGGRIESRINEMFNVITVGGSSSSRDYRKK